MCETYLTDTASIIPFWPFFFLHYTLKITTDLDSSSTLRQFRCHVGTMNDTMFFVTLSSHGLINIKYDKIYHQALAMQCFISKSTMKPELLFWSKMIYNIAGKIAEWLQRVFHSHRNLRRTRRKRRQHKERFTLGQEVSQRYSTLFKK